MDYREIIDNLKDETVVELMKRLGADRYREEDNCIIFPTICHNEDAAEASMKLYYYRDTKLFVCYTSCQTMSIFKFLKNYYETRGIEYDWVTDIYNVVLNCSNFRNEEGISRPKYRSLKEVYGKERKTVILPEYNEGALDTFIRRYPAEWLMDGISREAMERFDIRYSISQNKIIIPHRDADGRLVGIRGRALNEWEIENVGKYLPIKLEQTWYKHPLGLNLYGLYENKEAIRKGKICYVCESEKAVMQMDSFAMPNCSVAVCGSQFNKYQLNLLLKYCRPQEIVICFDKEEKKGEDTYFMKLWNLCQKYKEYCQFSFIYDRQDLLNMKDSPTDKGEEVFRKLLDKRVKVK